MTQVESSALLVPIEAKCLNELCKSSSVSLHNGCESYCSHHCAFIHALETYRELAKDEAKPELLLARSTHKADTAESTKLHTSVLLRCGIDPWAPAAEICMRRHFGKSLLLVFDGHCLLASNAELAWSMENLTYSMSYLPAYLASWEEIGSSVLVSNIQRYHFLCAEILRHIKLDKARVCLMLSSNVHASVFYYSLFGCHVMP
ncbi:hypothetical protein GGI02_000298 [Coemansia sp. RSA 2322]|nr:hypothetical protein GGI02_000298 [Coemansia sp. RSA 2322]